MHTPKAPMVRFCLGPSQRPGLPAHGWLPLLGLLLCACTEAPLPPAAAPEPMAEPAHRIDAAMPPSQAPLDGVTMIESWEHAQHAAAEGFMGALAPVGYTATEYQGEGYLLHDPEPVVLIQRPGQGPVAWENLIARHLNLATEPQAARSLSPEEAAAYKNFLDGRAPQWALDGAELLKLGPLVEGQRCAVCHQDLEDPATVLAIALHLREYADD